MLMLHLFRHKFIVIYKTAYYSFYLPVALALHQQKIATPKNLKIAEDILIPLGEYFQIPNELYQFRGGLSVYISLGGKWVVGWHGGPQWTIIP